MAPARTGLHAACRRAPTQGLQRNRQRRNTLRGRGVRWSKRRTVRSCAGLFAGHPNMPGARVIQFDADMVRDGVRIPDLLWGARRRSGQRRRRDEERGHGS